MVEEDSDRLVIDPGVFSKSFIDYQNIKAVVVTHVHQDHFDPVHLNKIISANPNVEVYSTEQVAKEFNSSKVKIVTGGDNVAAGPFNLEFFGGQHELFQDTQNVGILVNGSLYYPGDSYSKLTTSSQLSILATPASAPWLRVTEAADFIKACKAQKVFPSHNALLSEIGESIQYGILSGAAKEAGSDWQVLKTGETLEL